MDGKFIDYLSVARTPSLCEINALATRQSCHVTPCYKRGLVPQLVLSLLAALRVFFRSRRDTAIEVLALRQQVAVLKRKRLRPELNSWDRLFWTVLRSLWPRWRDVLVIVKPETVVAWSPCRFSPLLAVAFPPARRSAEASRGGSTAHPTNGGRECRLGRTQNPR
jgi:hypothetical protein